MFAALQLYPAFRRLWMGSQGASLGQWMQQIGLGWLALELTDSQAFVGLVSFVGGVPFLLLSVPSGIILDRLDRRKIMLACQAAAATVALLISLAVITDIVRPAHLIVTALLTGALQAMMVPAQQSLVPNLVSRRDLTNAIGLTSAGMNLTRIVGPSIAGVLIGWFGTSSAFIAQSLALLLAFFFVLGVPSPESRRIVPTGGKAVFEGVSLIAKRPDLRGLFLLACIPAFFAFPYLSFLNVFARDILEIGASGLGFLMAASGAGALTGSLLLASKTTMTGMGRVLIIGTLIYGLAIVCMAYSSTVWLTLPLLFCGGLLGSVFMSGNNALVQMQINDRVRGRVMSAYLLNMGLTPLGALPMGYIGGRIGISHAVAIGATLCIILSGIVGLRNRTLRQL